MNFLGSLVHLVESGGVPDSGLVVLFSLVIFLHSSWQSRSIIVVCVSVSLVTTSAFSLLRRSISRQTGDRKLEREIERLLWLSSSIVV